MKRICFFILFVFFAAPLFAQNSALTESPVIINTLAGTISGTLSVPSNIKGKIPVVLILADTGPIDRNGNSPKLGLATNSYKLIAEALGKNDIATLRYDKRMVGESAPTQKENNLHFEDYVDDAIGMINLLKDDKRFSKIIVLGHGEGALVGILASSGTEETTRAFISVEGISRRADQYLSEQMKSKSSYLADEFKVVLDSLSVGKTERKVDPALYFIARPSIQRYLMTWCRYEPLKEIKELKIPILIVQGGADLDIPMSDADKFKKAKSSATLALIHSMNHVLKEAPADKDKNLATYSQPDLPLKPDFVTTVVDFIHGLK